MQRFRRLSTSTMGNHRMNDTPDQIVIDEHNGRPSILLEVKEDGILLRWMLMGQAEPFVVWLQVHLSESEASEFVERPPLLVGPYLQTLSTRGVDVLMVSTAGEEIAVTGIFNAPNIDLPVFALTALAAALDAEISGHHLREQRARAARLNLTQLSAVG